MADDSTPKIRRRAGKPARPSGEPRGDSKGTHGTVKREGGSTVASRPPRPLSEGEPANDASSQPPAVVGKIGTGKARSKSKPRPKED